MKHELTTKDLTWVTVQSPEPEELAEFIREVGLTAPDAEYVAQKYHRPSLTARSDYLLLLVQVPVFDRQLRLTRGTSLFMIIKENKLYTLHYDPIIPLEKVRRHFEVSPDRQEEYFLGGGLQLGLDVLTMLYDSAFRKLERLAKHIDIAEDAVFQGNERRMVEEISLLTRDVMDFRKVIRPQKMLFASTPQQSLVTPEAATKWSRVHGQLLKMWEVLESMFESVRELSNTNYILLQHKENELLRVLTIYSIIVIPMIILTDPIFTPGADNASLMDIVVFWTVLGILILTLLVLLIRFRGKRLV